MRNLTGAEFLALVKAGKICIPTDKSYKVYVGSDKFYFENFTAEEAQEFANLLEAQQVTCGFPYYFYSGVSLPQIGAHYVRVEQVSQ